MLGYFFKLINWINQHKISAYVLYIVLPIVSYFLNIYKNYSWDLITICLVLVFILRIIVGIIISINLLSFKKRKKLNKSEKRKNKPLIKLLILKIVIGIFITILPLFLSNNFAHNFINEKLENETNIETAKIYELIYAHNGHLSGAMGYKYEFYIKNRKYRGRHLGEKRKIGGIIEIKYYKENPWINKKNE